MVKALDYKWGMKERKMSKKKRMENLRSKIYMFILDIVYQVVCLCPWIPTAGNERLNIITYTARMFLSGDRFTYIRENLGVYLEGAGTENDIMALVYIFYLQIILMCIVQALGILHILLVWYPKNINILYVAMSVIEAVNVALVNEGVMWNMFVDYIPAAVCVAVMLGLPVFSMASVNLMESWAEASAEYRVLKERDRELKRERKRRLYFPGKYTSLFYRVIWKNFRFQLGVYKIFLIVGSLSVSFVFAGFGMWEMLSSQELGEEMYSFLVMAIVAAVFLIVNVLLYYMKNHMKDYSMFLNLGMRKQTLGFYVATELISSMVVSLLAGTVLGNGIVRLCRVLITKAKADGVAFSPLTQKTYLGTLACVLIIFVVSVLATHDIYIDTGMAGAADKAVRKEKMPQQLLVVRILAGAFFIRLSVQLYTKRVMAENIFALIPFILGWYLILKTLWSIWLRRARKREENYYRGLMRKNYLYYRFKSVFRYTFFIGLIHLCIIFVFAKDIVSIMAAPEAKDLFPYDYVCMATEDDEEFFGKLEKKYRADIQIYPMVRVSNVDNTLVLDSLKDITLQGQHIGISASTYEVLCENVGVEPEKLNLSADGSDVYIVYQQDESVHGHFIDYYAYSGVPYLHVGQPLFYYFWAQREQFFPRRETAGESTQILTGALRQGKHENLLVFSDEYIEQMQDSWQEYNYLTGEPLGGEEAVEGENVHHWPTRLVLIRADEGVKEEIDEKLAEFRAAHEFDESFDSEVSSCYVKDELVEKIESERIMKMTLNLFIVSLMFMAGVIMLYLKNQSEILERKRKHEFLVCMGMSKKERLKLFKSEFWSYLWRPMTLAFIGGAVLTVIVWYLRSYDTVQCMEYLKIWGILFAGYTAVQILIMKVMEWFVIRKVEK